MNWLVQVWYTPAMTVIPDTPIQDTTVFSRTADSAWRIPAVLIACFSLVAVFAFLTTDQGLVWALSGRVVRAMGTFGLMMAGVVVGWVLLELAVVFKTGEFENDPFLHAIYLMGGGILSMIVFLCVDLSGRLPTAALKNHAMIEHAVRSGARNDPVLEWMQQLLDNPTHRGMGEGAALMRRSLRGQQMNRAMAAARIVGLDGLGVVKAGSGRGWMTPEEFKQVQAAAVQALREQSQGKSMAWQAAALVLTDRDALSRPISLQAAPGDR